MEETIQDKCSLFFNPSRGVEFLCSCSCHVSCCWFLLGSRLTCAPVSYGDEWWRKKKEKKRKDISPGAAAETHSATIMWPWISSTYFFLSSQTTFHYSRVAFIKKHFNGVLTFSALFLTLLSVSLEQKWNPPYKWEERKKEHSHV